MPDLSDAAVDRDPGKRVFHRILTIDDYSIGLFVFQEKIHSRVRAQSKKGEVFLCMLSSFSKIPSVFLRLLPGKPPGFCLFLADNSPLHCHVKVTKCSPAIFNFVHFVSPLSPKNCSSLPFSQCTRLFLSPHPGESTPGLRPPSLGSPRVGESCRAATERGRLRPEDSGDKRKQSL